MTAYRPEFDGQPVAPVYAIADAMAAADRGEAFALTAEQALAAMHLDGDEPDGATLMERLVYADVTEAAYTSPDVSALRTALGVQYGVRSLIELTNDRTANEQQEGLAQILGAAVGRQVNREGDICPRARELVLSSTRDDIISPEVREAVLAAEAARAAAHDDSDMPEWARGMAGMPPEVVLGLLSMALEQMDRQRGGFGLGSLLRGGLGGRMIIVRGGNLADFLGEDFDLGDLGDYPEDRDDRRRRPYDEF